MKKLVKKNIAAAVTVFAALLTVAALFLGTAAIRQNSDENGESVPFFEGVFSVGQKERLTYFDVADGVSALSKDDVLKYEANIHTLTPKRIIQSFPKTSGFFTAFMNTHLKIR